MAPKKKKKICRESAAVAISSRVSTSISRRLHDTVSPSTTDPGVYQLRVINGCGANGDIHLPRQRPQAALLAAFYTYGWRPDMDEAKACCEVARGPAKAGNSARQHYRDGPPRWRRQVSLTATQWMEHITHVVIGRHSALPTNYRLQHPFIARLHARVVLIESQQMHSVLSECFPPIIKQDTELSDFLNSYYMLINYSENPVYVNDVEVTVGRSWRLQEGDVVSFLECGFDEDYGVLLPRGVDSKAPAATKRIKLEEDEDDLHDAATELSTTGLPIGKCEASSPVLTPLVIPIPSYIKTLTSMWEEAVQRSRTSVKAEEVEASDIQGGITPHRMEAFVKACEESDAAEGGNDEVQSPLRGRFLVDVAAARKLLFPARTAGRADARTPSKSQRRAASFLPDDEGEESPIKSLIVALQDQHKGSTPTKSKGGTSLTLRLQGLDDEACSDTANEDVWRETSPEAAASPNAGAVSSSNSIREVSPVPWCESGSSLKIAPTAVPFVFYEPPRLPVYVFEKRSPSPGATTHDAAWRQRSAQQAWGPGQFVYYYNDDEPMVEGAAPHGGEAAGDGGTCGDVGSPTVTEEHAIWVDESGAPQPRRRKPRGKKRGRK